MATHPLPTLADGRAAVVSSGFGPRKQSGKMVKHKGADLTYRAAPGDPSPRIVNGKVVYTAQRTKAFYSPPGLVVRATEPGIVVQAKVKPGVGGDVWLHHPASGNVTRYAHLSKLAVKLGQEVAEGQALGIWGAGSGTPFVHLHFELLTAGKKDSQRDPASYLADAQPQGAPARPSAAVARAGASTAPGGLLWLLLLIGVLASTKS